jgi:hypothetical protein
LKGFRDESLGPLFLPLGAAVPSARLVSH